MLREAIVNVRGHRDHAQRGLCQSTPDERQSAVSEPIEPSRLESKLAAKVFLSVASPPLGKAELAKAPGHPTVSGELHKQIRRLVHLKLIEMTVPDKPQSSLQRYCLAELGRQLHDQTERQNALNPTPSLPAAIAYKHVKWHGAHAFTVMRKSEP